MRGTRLPRGLGLPSEVPDKHLYQGGECKNLPANNSLTKKVLFHIIKQCSDQINTHANGVIAEGLGALLVSPLRLVGERQGGAAPGGTEQTFQPGAGWKVDQGGQGSS